VGFEGAEEVEGRAMLRLRSEMGVGVTAAASIDRKRS
jgi:hypothetical protein